MLSVSSRAVPEAAAYISSNFLINFINDCCNVATVFRNSESALAGADVIFQVQIRTSSVISLIAAPLLFVPQDLS